MNFWNKYQWTVVGIAGTIVIHLILLLFLNFKTLPEVVATNEVLIDFAEEIKPTTDDLQEVQEAGEDGRPLTNVAADVNTETQMSSRIDKEKLSGEVDKLVQELESQYRNEATRSQEALEKLEKQREERQNKNSLYDESAEDVEAVQGKKGVRASAEWSLSKRKNFDLPAPSYVCKGQGEVHISIKVNNQGEVTAANIVESQTNTSLACLREQALAYAKRARFNDDYSVSNSQKGWIHFTYSKQ